MFNDNFCFFLLLIEITQGLLETVPIGFLLNAHLHPVELSGEVISNCEEIFFNALDFYVHFAHFFLYHAYLLLDEVVNHPIVGVFFRRKLD